MEILSAEHIDDAVWDALCDASPDAWERHTSMARKHSVTLSEGTRDCSFGVMHQGALVAVMPLLSQPLPGGLRKEFAMGGTPAPFPACGNELTTAERVEALTAAFAEIDRLAAELGIARTHMFVDPLTEPILTGTMHTNPLPAFGYQDTSITTSCVDLSKEESVLLNNIASRRRRYISASIREQQHRVDFFDPRTITHEIFSQFEELYAAAAGRPIGSPERRDQLLWRLQEGHALLTLAYVPGESLPRAGHFSSLYKKRSYDGLSAIRPEYKNDHALNSVMQWETIRYLKAHGYTHYEIGWIFPPTTAGSAYSPKELAISHSKTLFGGELLPLFRGDKYYDTDYLQEQRAGNISGVS